MCGSAHSSYWHPSYVIMYLAHKFSHFHPLHRQHSVGVVSLYPVGVAQTVVSGLQVPCGLAVDPFQGYVVWLWIHSRGMWSGLGSIPGVCDLALDPFQGYVVWPWIHSRSMWSGLGSIPGVYGQALDPFQGYVVWSWIHSRGTVVLKYGLAN